MRGRGVERGTSGTVLCLYEQDSTFIETSVWRPACLQATGGKTGTVRCAYPSRAGGCFLREHPNPFGCKPRLSPVSGTNPHIPFEASRRRGYRLGKRPYRSWDWRLYPTAQLPITRPHASQHQTLAKLVSQLLLCSSRARAVLGHKPIPFRGWVLDRHT
jgi:hypothetical protein